LAEKVHPQGTVRKQMIYGYLLFSVGKEWNVQECPLTAFIHQGHQARNAKNAFDIPQLTG
jgi:hypothetical protein